MRLILAVTTLTLVASCHGPVVTSAVRTSDAPAGLIREQTADEQVNHILSRLTFGARPGDVQLVRRIGVDRWIEQQLRPDQIVDSALTRHLAGFATRTKGAVELWEQAPPRGILRGDFFRQRAINGKLSARDSVVLDSLEHVAQAGRARLLRDIEAGRVIRAVATERQLQEVVTDFWLNHFSVYGAPYGMPNYEHRVVRPNALGKFRTLLGAVAKSGAMLEFLGNGISVAETDRPRLSRNLPKLPGGVSFQAFTSPRPVDTLPWRAPHFPPEIPIDGLVALGLMESGHTGLNENYARELMELHTLGVDGGYTQEDVHNVARALTGWWQGYPRVGADSFVLLTPAHDAGGKVVLGHLLAAGRGVQDGEDVLDVLAGHPSTAHHIAFKLARRFVSDEPPEALVARAAATYMRTDGDIREVVRTIVTSPEFFSREAYRSKVKSPFELVTSALRALGAEPDTTRATAAAVAKLGQPIFGHLTPEGWPETSRPWMNSGAILQRINFGMDVASGRFPGAGPAQWHLGDGLITASKEHQVDAIVGSLLAGHLSPDTRRVLEQGQNPLTKSGVEDVDGAGGSMHREAPHLDGLSLLVGLALGSPEFQRR